MVFLLLSSAAASQTLVLKSGRSVVGEIVEEGDDAVKMRVSGVEVTFYRDEIERLEDAPGEDAPRIDKRFFYRVTKTFHIKALTDIMTLQFQYPLVRNDIPFQRIFDIHTTPEANAIVDDPDNNKIAVFYFSERKTGEDMRVVITYAVEVARPVLDIDPDSIPDQYDRMDREVQAALEPRETNPQIVQLAQDLGAGKTNPYRKARAIYEELVNHWTYENIEGTSGFQSLQETLNYKKGNCTDITRLFIALARLNGIPARQVDGTVFQPNVALDKSVSQAGHAWAEIYLPVYGWQPVDATFGLNEKEKFFCFLYDIHLRECYGQLTSSEPGSLYRGSHIEMRTRTKSEGVPIRREAEITVELLRAQAD